MLKQKIALEIVNKVALPYVAGSDIEYKETLERHTREAKDAANAERKANREYEHARADYNRKEAQITRLEVQIKSNAKDARREHRGSRPTPT